MGRPVRRKVGPVPISGRCVVKASTGARRVKPSQKAGPKPGLVGRFPILVLLEGNVHDLGTTFAVPVCRSINRVGEAVPTPLLRDDADGPHVLAGVGVNGSVPVALIPLPRRSCAKVGP